LGQKLLFSVHGRTAGEQAGIYAQAVGGKPQIWSALPGGKSQVAISPDGKWVVYDDFTATEEAILVRVDASGENPLRLASFQRSGVSGLAWSPDGEWLAFIVNQNSGSQGSTNLFAIRKDGRDLRQLFNTRAVQSIAWAPDSAHLVIAGGTSAQMRLFIASLDGSAARLLSAPGLSQDTDWRAPSWGW
jgi:Tol biopolymer transport system component